MDQDSLSKQIAAAARDLEGELDPRTTMEAAVRLGVEIVAGAQDAAVSLLQGRDHVDTPAATSEAVRRVDELQYEHDEGPCLDAIREHQVVHSPDVRTDVRWPAWGPAAAEQTGLRSMLCFRLFTHGDKLGALNFYSRQTDAFDADDRENGLAITAQAAIAMAAAQEIDDLKTAIDTRTMIGQATGILMGRFDMDATRAFAVLTRLSSHNNRKLRDIAQDIVTTRLLPDESRGNVDARS